MRAMQFKDGTFEIATAITEEEEIKQLGRVGFIK